jgi:hypothetical protein
VLIIDITEKEDTTMLAPVQRIDVRVRDQKLLLEYLRFLLDTAKIHSFEDFKMKVVDHHENSLDSELLLIAEQNGEFPMVLITEDYLPNNTRETPCFSRRAYDFHENGTTNSIDEAVKYVEEILRRYEDKWLAEIRRKLGGSFAEIGFAIRFEGESFLLSMVKM